jgi:hypothetical protein
MLNANYWVDLDGLPIVLSNWMLECNLTRTDPACPQLTRSVLPFVFSQRA